MAAPPTACAPTLVATRLRRTPALRGDQREGSAFPMPKWWGHVNKRAFNPRAIANGKWPVSTHVGRTSGNSYRTPLDVYPVDGGFLFVPVYGSGADWVRNVLASGRARLEINWEAMEL